MRSSRIVDGATALVAATRDFRPACSRSALAKLDDACAPRSMPSPRQPAEKGWPCRHRASKKIITALEAGSRSVRADAGDRRRPAHVPVAGQRRCAARLRSPCARRSSRPNAYRGRSTMRSGSAFRQAADQRRARSRANSAATGNMARSALPRRRDQRAKICTRSPGISSTASTPTVGLVSTSISSRRRRAREAAAASRRCRCSRRRRRARVPSERPRRRAQGAVQRRGRSRRAVSPASDLGGQAQRLQSFAGRRRCPRATITRSSSRRWRAVGQRPRASRVGGGNPPATLMR